LTQHESCASSLEIACMTHHEPSDLVAAIAAACEAAAVASRTVEPLRATAHPELRAALEALPDLSHPEELLGEETGRALTSVLDALDSEIAAHTWQVPMCGAGDPGELDPVPPMTRRRSPAGERLAEQRRAVADLRARVDRARALWHAHRLLGRP
jgi:hypothetical protein